MWEKEKETVLQILDEEKKDLGMFVYTVRGCLPPTGAVNYFWDRRLSDIVVGKSIDSCMIFQI